MNIKRLLLHFIPEITVYVFSNGYRSVCNAKDLYNSIDSSYYCEAWNVDVEGILCIIEPYSKR